MIKRILITTVVFLGLLAGVFLVLKQTGFWGKAFGTPANLVVDAGSSFILPGSCWANLAQGGEEQGVRMLAPVISGVKALSPKYIRLDHLYGYYDLVSRGSDGVIQYNWAKLDSTINDVLATGAKPFLSLSYTPPALSGGNVDEKPQSWGEWEKLVQVTVEHYSGVRGMGISDVYYEVWNEPDLFGKFKVSGDKNYLELYLHTAVGAMRAGNVLPFKLGGPATTGLYKNWINGLLVYASRNSLRLDFISWHRYSKSLSDYEKDYINAKSWIENYPQYKDVELIISEAGPNSENDKVYDGAFAASHALATSALLEGDVSKLFLFEIKDGPGPEKYWGRWGIYTHEKWGAPEAKPRYSAIQFLNNMRGAKVNVAGEGSWVRAFAKEENRTIRLFIVNYDPSGSHSETVPITFTNLPYKSFYARRINYGGPAEGKTQITVEGSSWATVEDLKPNRAIILELTPV